MADWLLVLFRDDYLERERERERDYVEEYALFSVTCFEQENGA